MSSPSRAASGRALPGPLAALTGSALVTALTATLAPALLAPPPPQIQDPQGPPRIIAWNDLGMHCIDPDFSVFSILPPFNTINSQLMIDGELVAQAGQYSITYEAVADASGSINSTSVGKTNFWDHAQALYGANLAPDEGLTGSLMPGLANVPQPMHFDTAWSWFQGEGIPITPYDDTFAKNPYPLLRIVVRDAGGNEVTSTVTVAPNSAELACDRCHASGSNPDARPEGGWVWNDVRVLDDHLNILALHDRHLGEPTFDAALQTTGYGAAGLLASAQNGQPILCAACHGTNALPGTGLPGVSMATAAMHGLHGRTRDENGATLESIPTREACYLCHPGFDTQCLRGAMGHAIGSDGEFAMHCQSCHGSMSDVGDPEREGWFDAPTCDNCHSGTATDNNGQIRYDTVFDANGDRRVAVNDTFATTPDTPLAGFSLYRFSEGHGGLQCSACHGSPHAIFPTRWPNDDLQAEQLQGHAGTIMECSVCHSNLEDDEMFPGPHGMHPTTGEWANGKHGDFAEHGGLSECRACHGANDRGTVLSLAQDDRSYSNEFGTQTYARGNVVGCYDCHDGPDGEDGTNNGRPVAQDLAVSTPTDVPVDVTLVATDPSPLTYRIVEQPLHGTVAFAGGTVATYRAKDGYVGPDSFRYAAEDPLTDSNVATVTVNVGQPACKGTLTPYGHPCIASDGSRPTLSATGCPTPGTTIALHIDGMYGGSAALLAVGASMDAVELVPTCTLRLGDIVYDFLPVIGLAGSGPGDGTATFLADLPAGLGTTTMYVQAFGFDPGLAFPFVGTNGLEIHVE